MNESADDVHSIGRAEGPEATEQKRETTDGNERHRYRRQVAKGQTCPIGQCSEVEKGTAKRGTQETPPNEQTRQT